MRTHDETHGTVRSRVLFDREQNKTHGFATPVNGSTTEHTLDYIYIYIYIYV